MKSLSPRMALAVLVVANLVLGVVLLSLHPARVSATVRGQPPVLPTHVQALFTQVSAGRHSEPYNLSLSSQELTEVANYFVTISPDIPFTHIEIVVTGEKVVLDAVTRGLAVSVPVRVTGTVGAQAGAPQARVENVSLGDTPLPGVLRDQILRQANASLDFSKYDMPVTVDALELRTGSVTVHGTIK